MAKIRRYKLTWEASKSKNITGYKIYWSNSESINYDSKSIDVGNVTEVILSSDITSSGNMVMFGVVAIDTDGNESDINRLDKPYQFHIPHAPEQLSLRPMEDFKIVSMSKPQFKTSQNVDPVSSDKDGEDDPLAEAIESKGETKKSKIKYYDDVGYRNLP